MRTIHRVMVIHAALLVLFGALVLATMADHAKATCTTDSECQATTGQPIDLTPVKGGSR